MEVADGSARFLSQVICNDDGVIVACINLFCKTLQAIPDYCNLQRLCLKKVLIRYSSTFISLKNTASAIGVKKCDLININSLSCSL